MFGGLRVGTKTNADYLQGGGDFVPNSRFNEYSIKANAGFLNKIGTFKLFYDFNNQKLGLVEDEAIENITEVGRANKIWYQEFNTHLLSSQNKLFLGKSKLDVHTAYQNTELIHFGAENFYELQMKLATLTYEVKWHLPSQEKSEYIIGFQGLNQKNSNINDRETLLLPDASIDNYSAFGLMSIDIINNLKFQTGIRYDKKFIQTEAVGIPTETETYRPALDKSFGSFSGSLGSTYHFSESLLVRANFAAAYRTPNLAELTSNGQHELRYELGDSQLVPEKAYETDLSLHFHKENLTIDLAGFYNIVNHYIFIAPTGATSSEGIPVYQYRQQNSTLVGGEAGLHIHPEKLNFMHFETTFSTVVGKQEDGTYLPFVPAHKLNFEIRAEKEKISFLNNAFIAAKTSTAFEQHNVAPDETRTGAYTLLDLSIGASIKWQNQSVLLNLSANNIMDTKYIDHLSTLKEVGLFNMGRNISFLIKIPFGIPN